MFNPLVYYNSRPDGFGVLEVTGEEVEGARLFVPLKRSELHGTVTGPLAALRLTQVYGYTKGECDKVLEAAYRFPLPGDASVTGVRVRFGVVEIQAELKPREQAEADYEQAKRQGKQAALVTRESPDVFTVQVAGIRPDEEITVETSYVQLARAQGAGWALRIPLTTAPRYVRSDELTSRHAHGQPLALLRDPGHRFSLDLTLEGAGAVESPTHRLQTALEGDATRVRLAEGEVVPDRDCLLLWRPRQDERRPALQVYAHDDVAAGHIYFLAQVAPPASPAPGRGLAREVILLVDHSGSMEGPKWDAADWAVVKFLSELSEGDAFNLCLFHSQTRWFARQPQRADGHAIERAVKFVREHRDSGGTELGVALEQSLSMPRTAGDYARHLLIITDAQVSDAGRILRLAEEEMEAPEPRRISVLCIDAAPNDFLAGQLAERGGGLARFLTSEPAEEDISTALDEVLADWAQPVLADLRLSVDRPQALPAGRRVREDGAIDLGDLPAGRTVWLAGRMARSAPSEVTFRLAARGGQVGSCRLGLAAESGGQPALKALFGAWRVAGLEFLINSGRSGQELFDQLARLGFDPAQAVAGAGGKPPLYAENARAEAEKALRGLLVREALSYGLASSETAFVAVRRERGHVVEATAIVANALPMGWSEDFAAGAMLSTSAAPPAPRSLRSFLSDTGGAGSAFLRRNSASRGVSGKSRHMLPTDSSAEAAPRPELATLVFTGVPAFAQGEALLFDTERPEDRARLPEGGILSRLLVAFAEGWPRQLDPGLELLLYVDDPAAPRARVRLADLARQGGERPLNVGRGAESRVRLVLVDPAGAWASGAPSLEVRLLVG